MQTYSPKEKAEILREHFMDKKPVSEICREYGIRRESFELWKKALFDNGDLAVEKTAA